MRKVAIIGTAPLSRDLAPYSDNDWEIWVCSAGNMQAAGVKRVTRWFELHANVELEAPENQSWATPYFAWLRAQTFPVWTLQKTDLVPQSQVFPSRELLTEFGREWFTSSVAWMQALAIYEKVDEIGIFGVDMAADQEHYTGQRMGCRRFIEIAKERGIKTVIPWESCLGTPPPIYGLWEATPMGRRINVTEQMIVAKRGEIDQTVRRLELERAFFDGATEQLRYFKRTFVDGSNAYAHMDEEQALADAAKRAVDNIMGAPAAQSSLPTGELIPPSALRPPPAMEDERPAATNGAGAGHPLLGYPEANKTSGWPSQGQGEAR